MNAVQREEQLYHFNFSTLFIYTDNAEVYGFIGKNYQRLHIKILQVTKDTALPGIYHVYGKSMVKSNINDFEGTIKITRIVRLIINKHGCENESKYKGYKGQYSLFGVYTFDENNKQLHSGVFSGNFRSDYFINKNSKIIYDDIENCSDSYTNNQFRGTWKSYKSGLTEICNWGDYRIPNSGDFDIGAGDFSPNTNDTTLGWQSIHDMWLTGRDNKPTAKSLQAKKIENTQWWNNH